MRRKFTIKINEKCKLPNLKKNHRGTQQFHIYHLIINIEIFKINIKGGYGWHEEKGR